MPKRSKLFINPMYWHFPIFSLAVKRSRSTQGLHLKNLGSTQVPNANTKFQGHPSIGSEEEDF